MRLGYILSCEEFAPAELLAQARMAEQAGFDALWISDHFHPWNDEQGESSFVWSMIGALSQACDLPITTAVTCPTMRIHPAVIAQAAATSQVLLGGRFRLGIGSGEALNEHILGDAWPGADVRLNMLEEAVEVMRKLFTGKVVDHRGEHYTVEHARLYTLPDEPRPSMSRLSALRRPPAPRGSPTGSSPPNPIPHCWRRSGRPVGTARPARRGSRSATARTRPKLERQRTDSGATNNCPANSHRYSPHPNTSCRRPL